MITSIIRSYKVLGIYDSRQNPQMLYIDAIYNTGRKRRESDGNFKSSNLLYIIATVYLWPSMHQISIFSVHFYYRHHICLGWTVLSEYWFSSSSSMRAPQFSVLGGVYFLFGVLYKVNWCHQVWVEIFCCFLFVCVCVMEPGVWVEEVAVTDWKCRWGQVV